MVLGLIFFTILFYFVYRYTVQKKAVSVPIVVDLNPIPTTQYPFSEKMILSTFSGSKINMEDAYKLYNPVILQRIGKPFPNLECYVLHTNTFSGTLDPTEFDIIGAFFFYHLQNLLVDCEYYEGIKKILIPETTQKTLINLFQTNPNITFTGQLMDLDDFIPRISKFFYYDYNRVFYVDYLTLKNSACS